ncbi:hypothetical protein PoB_000769400 [Plakobranchus ocellatus]|uniref:Uncharacterized protein n=1 Tax=Plakobranchus ocellatus TaxID=259542 RepID=A0AAV3YGN4_9GAST|nr:hypothetical protein PoB_000769400 [Plakobranchus ocellatus]
MGNLVIVPETIGTQEHDIVEPGPSNVSNAWSEAITHPPVALGVTGTSHPDSAHKANSTKLHQTCQAKILENRSEPTQKTGF